MKLSDLTLYNSTVLINDTDIEVLQYISIEDKNSIINMSLQNAKEGTFYNECRLKMYFELYIVYSYFILFCFVTESILQSSIYSTGGIAAIML